MVPWACGGATSSTLLYIPMFVRFEGQRGSLDPCRQPHHCKDTPSRTPTELSFGCAWTPPRSLLRSLCLLMLRRAAQLCPLLSLLLSLPSSFCLIMCPPRP